MICGSGDQISGGAHHSGHRRAVLCACDDHRGKARRGAVQGLVGTGQGSTGRDTAAGRGARQYRAPQGKRGCGAKGRGEPAVHHGIRDAVQPARGDRVAPGFPAFRGPQFRGRVRQDQPAQQIGPAMRSALRDRATDRQADKNHRPARHQFDHGDGILDMGRQRLAPAQRRQAMPTLVIADSPGPAATAAEPPPTAGASCDPVTSGCETASGNDRTCMGCPYVHTTEGDHVPA